MTSKTLNALAVRIPSITLGVALSCLLVSALHAGPPADQKAAGGAQQPPKTFATAQEAADALIQAAGHDDANALVEIFGADGKNLVETGDEVQDKNGRASFAKLAEQ